MVNYNPYLDEAAATNANSSSSALFSLSKPINFLDFSSQPAIKLPLLQRSLHEVNFTFLEPFESCHVRGRHSEEEASSGGKLSLKKATHMSRPQPYTLGKPVSNTSSSISATQASNGIMSRLTNISSTLKAIFVRPKHSRPVDLASISHRKTAQEAKAAEETATTAATATVNSSGMGKLFLG